MDKIKHLKDGELELAAPQLLELLSAEREKNATQEKEMKEARKLIGELQEELSHKTVEAATQKKLFAVGKQKYEFLPGSYAFEGVKVTYESLKEDEKLAKKLIDMQVGFIQPFKEEA